MSALGLEDSYAALREGVVGTVLALDVVRVSGPDALSYLQGQVSQDLDSLAPRRSVESLLLSPQGKLDAFCRVTMTDDGELVVVVDAGFGETVLERLARFKVRVKAELGLEAWQATRLVGPGASAIEVAALAEATFDYPGFVGRDLLGPTADLPSGVPAGDPAAFEAARIEAGLPKMGREITDKTIPQESGIVDRTVSFTKGCYTGQELVARIDARGNRVPRRLVGFTTDREAAAGDSVMVDGRQVGALTSVTFSPGVGRIVALGYLRREVEVPADVEVGDGETLGPAVASALPLYRA